MSPTRVTITQEGRSGSVRYEEAAGAINGWWEFAGSDAIAIVSMGAADEWVRGHAWALERRSTILRYVADEVIRQKAAGCKADIDEAGGWIEIRQ